MIEIIQEYWKSLLWTDGYRYTGVAITLWLLISSVVMGGILALFLAIGRVSSNKFIQFPIWLFTYIFRGTPLYVQLLVFYSGMYTLEIVKGTDFLNAFFRSGLNCTVLALTLNTCAYTTEIFASILSAEYADAMLKKGTPENVDNWPIGTGPYVLQQYKQDSQIRYLANPNYWDGAVPTKHLIFSITPNVQTRLAKLQTNECQIIPAPAPVQFDEIKKNKDLTLHSVDALNVGYLAFNTEKKPFDNVLVRQALNYATDKKAIINAVFLGSGTVAKSPIPPNMLGFNKDLQDYAYDPQKAKDLLKQAGLENGFEATLWSMPVQRPYNPNSRRIAEMIQSDWAKVGVKAKIVSYEWGEYLSGMRKGEHDTALFGWMSDNGDPDNFADVLLGCDSIKTGSNAARWCDKEYNSLVEKAKLVSKPEERAALYQQSQEIFYQQAPWIALANGKTFYATRSNVSGYSVSLMGSDFSKAKLN